MADTLPLALSVLSKASGKQIVFCPTARATALAADIFRALGHPNVFDIHSRKSQSMRTKTMSEFRSAQSGVLFSSDVTARGVDVPGITLVLQLNLPMSEEQYVHRLGRTARAGQAGTGMLVLAKHEEWFLKKLSDLPLQQINPPSLDKERQLVNDAMKRVDEDSRSKAYQAVSQITPPPYFCTLTHTPFLLLLFVTRHSGTTRATSSPWAGTPPPSFPK